MFLHCNNWPWRGRIYRCTFAFHTICSIYIHKKLLENLEQFFFFFETNTAGSLRIQPHRRFCYWESLSSFMKMFRGVLSTVLLL